MTDPTPDGVRGTLAHRDLILLEDTVTVPPDRPFPPDSLLHIGLSNTARPGAGRLRRAGEHHLSADGPESGALTATLVIEQVGAALVLRVGGELDTFTVPGLQTRLREAVASDTGPVVLDLTGARFVGSSALRLLLDMDADLTTAGRALRVVTGRALVVTRALIITGLDKVLALYLDLPTALGTEPEPGDQAV